MIHLVGIFCYTRCYTWHLGGGENWPKNKPEVNIYIYCNGVESDK